MACLLLSLMGCMISQDTPPKIHSYAEAEQIRHELTENYAAACKVIEPLIDTDVHVDSSSSYYKLNTL